MSSEHNNHNNAAEATTPQPLGIAGNMAKAFIHSPLAPLL